MKTKHRRFRRQVALALLCAGAAGCELDDSPMIDDDIPEDVAAALAELEWATVDFGAGPTEIVYEDVDGTAIMEGDIVLGPTELVASGQLRLWPLHPGADEPVPAAAIRLNAWPGGRIPYEIDEDEIGWPLHGNVIAAIDTWNATGAVLFVPATSSDTSKILIRGAASNMSAFEGRAEVGFRANDTRLVRLGSALGTKTVIHELGHVIGLLHEHTRLDRNNFVSINWSNVRDDRIGNFVTHGSSELDFGSYDINSVMQYGSFSFGKNVLIPTMVAAGCSFSFPAPGCLLSSGANPTASDVRSVFRQHAGASFRLRNDMNERCLRPSGGSTASGAAVITSTCSNTRSRRWFRFRRGDKNADMIVNENSRLCLTAPSSGNGMIQQPCTGSANQLFDYVASSGGGHQLRKDGTSRCVRRISSRSQVILSSRCNDTVSRRWFEQ